MVDSRAKSFVKQLLVIPENNTYRPDIDGLRAVAVLSVVLYHAGFSTFSGGYVGVDVFFVISGFLITRLLIKEVEETGRVDFFNFYLRRMRRLLPAFFFTLVCASSFAVWLLSPFQLESYGASLIHSVISASNIYFYSESGYFDTSASLKPLLHTWSLGVEEQFYLIWPFLLTLLAPRKLLVPIFITVAGIVSLYFSETMIAGHSEAVFFLMPFRIFEFSIGAVLIWLNPKKQLNPIILECLLFLGLSLILYSVFSYNEKIRFPGASAILPCLGATICIYAGNAPQVGKILRNKLFVGIGLISYSFYLAHWPIIVFYKNINAAYLTKIESILLVVASIAIAVFMYFWIEKPYRKVKPSNSYFLLVCALFSLSLSYIGASMWATGGWAWRSQASISSDTIKKNRELRFQTRQNICQRKSWEKCDAPVSGATNALIMGDSHAVDALNAFEKIYPTHNFSMSTLGGCPPYRDIELIILPNHPDRLKCKELNLVRFDPQYLKQFDYIVINVLFGWYTPEHLREYLDFLKANNIKKVIVLGDYLNLKQDMYDLINKYGYNTSVINNWLVNAPDIESTLKAQVEKHGYFFLSKRATLCQTGRCEIFDSNNIPFTHDTHHLSYEFAVRLAIMEKNAIDQYLDFKTNQNLKPPSNLLSVDLKIINWGPQSTNTGIVPNKQPSGGMGVWIEVSETKNIGEVQVLFAGIPAKTTAIQGKLITAEISPEQLSTSGKKEIAIKKLLTNELFPVGVFDVQTQK